MKSKPLEIRKAEKDDLERLKMIWKLCFEDEDSYIDFYFNNRDWREEMAVLLLNGSIVSMLTMIPADLIGENGEKIKSSMLYAIATHPQYRKQGLADKLMEWSSNYLLSNQIPVTMLVPAEPALYKFYEGRGYKTECFIRETILTRELIENLDDTNKAECRLYSAEPAQYNRIRKTLLEGFPFPYVDYREAEISFQKKTSQLFNADIYSILTEDEEGCAIVERTEEKVVVKELLITDKIFVSAIKEISAQMPAKRYIFRTPAFFACDIEGDIRPFGMVRVSSKLPNSLPQDIYLGIAYD
ncbi:MAG: GNAT family N-acetyltransferase [Eubacteriales bacterium]|nr:GNAT family N-acetyltransferase [Eubacteriales bacterium]